MKGFDLGLADIRARETEAQIAVEPLKQTVRDLKKYALDKKGSVESAQQDMADIKLQITDTEAQIRKLEKQIAIERQKQTMDHKSLEDDVNRKVDILSAKIEDYRKQIEKVLD